MIDPIKSNLKDLIKYAKGEEAFQDRAAWLAGLTVTTAALTFTGVGGDIATVFTVLGSGVPSTVKQILKNMNQRDIEVQAVDTYERCRFIDYALARMAVMQAIAVLLSDEERFYARWHVNKLTKEEQEKLHKRDEKREEQQVQNYLDKWELDHESYWDDLLAAILRVIEVEEDGEESFREKMINEIRKTYEAYKNRVMSDSKEFAQYMNSTVSPMRLTQSVKREIESMMISRDNGFFTIDDINSELRGSTEPTIDLTFFNYEEHDFEKQVIDKLSDQSQDVIYVKGKTREETLYYLLYIIGWIEKDHKINTVIVRSLEDWKRMKGTCKGKLLIPDFNASLVEPIPENRMVVVYGEADFIGKKPLIELKKRKLGNMLSKLRDSGNIDIKLASELVERTNGLYAGFKRRVFKGKSGEPGWEAQKNPNFVPALLIGAWTNNLGDQMIVARLASVDYEKYIKQLGTVVNNEDPFLLHFPDRTSITWRLANVEEAWEVLLKEIDSEQIQKFRELLLEVLGEVPSGFKLPIDRHYQAAVLTERPMYSDTMKQGLIRSLIMLADRINDHPTLWPMSSQDFVNEIVLDVFGQLDKKEQWFAISGLVPDLAEAAPQVTLKVIEREVSNPDSPLWSLFNENGDGLWSRNYYTNILWALEKTLCFEETAPQAVRILTKLAEKRINYKISNSPMSTLTQALSAWRQELNLSLEDKIRLTRSVVKQSDIGWDLIKALLPDRAPSHIQTNMCTPNYRPYQIRYKVNYTNDILQTFRDYTQIAINEAGEDLDRWGVLFEKFFFFELQLENEVIQGVVKVINRCQSDKEKHTFKEIIRDLLYQHRYFRDAKWAVDENALSQIEHNVFDVIHFDNPIYEEIHLFTSDQWHPLHPVSYRDNAQDFDNERVQLHDARREALLRILKIPQLGLQNLLSKIPNSNLLGLTDIGRIMASEVHEFKWNDEFIESMTREHQRTILQAYVGTLYQKHGLEVIQKALEKIQFDEIWSAGLLRLAKLDEAFLKLLKDTPPGVVRHYWESVPGFYSIENPAMQEEVWNRFLEYRNHSAALEMLHRQFRSNHLKHLQVLDNILKDLGRFNPDSHLVYLIVKVFERLYEADYLDVEQVRRAARQEWAFFNLLIHQTTPQFLVRELKSNPELLAQIIQLVYKPSDSPKDYKETLTEQQQQMVSQGHSILMQVKFCPCVDYKGDIAVSALKEWTKTYLNLIDHAKREAIGRQILGECFAHSPIGRDGNFPHEAIRSTFEEIYTPDLGKGFQIGVMNSRGVFNLSSGDEERKLSKMYETYARTLRIDYPHLAKELEDISEYYKRDSELDREKAAYDF
ncbi:hypothetical protein GC101_01045 [Paenibacillus sp. LMG 31459]|uniref:Uncharacterized protein n=1 Tax=Paenibacillus phytohabitans TaxID=2654978 RepID=A0ABX1Y942_9BACL|nr:hypothetical protein [Paenibacillus phytohabitans]NOU77458.1 hypothetical protein [Paenibacillus phytohabitans]